jgi:VanZ family protein
LSYRLYVRLLFFIALATISYLALAPLDDSPVTTGWDKLNHLLAFAVLLMLLDWGYPVLPLWHFKLPSLLFYACLIEFIQAFIPYREFSLLDIGADMLGLGIYLIVRPRLVSSLIFNPDRSQN